MYLCSGSKKMKQSQYYSHMLQAVESRFKRFLTVFYGRVSGFKCTLPFLTAVTRGGEHVDVNLESFH